MLLSIILPCYNEEEIIRLSLDSLTGKLLSFNIKNYEIICVDDGSKDNTLLILQEYSHKNTKIKIIELSANRGQQIAFYAGMCYSSGDAVIMMDADLQDPPDLIPEMIAKWQEGYQVVYGIRNSRKGETFIKKYTAHLFYRLLNKLSYVTIPKDTGEFRLIDKQVKNIIINISEHNRFNRALVSWLGFRSIGIPFERPKRIAGETKFGWKDMVQLAKDGLFSFSFFPIKFLQGLGIGSIIISICLTIYTLLSKFLWLTNTTGWSSLMIVIVFFSGSILFGMGILGEYIIRIHLEVINRPLFIAAKTTNLENKQLPSHLQKFY